MAKDERMHVVYASDRNYAAMLGVSLVSLLENNRNAPIAIHILDNGISEEDHGKIEGVCSAYGIDPPQWIQTEDLDTELALNVRCDRGSLSQFARIFIARHLDTSDERALYLDCDTIVRKPLTALWGLDLQGKTVGALLDAFSAAYRKNVNLEPTDIMINSGVLLIDMKKWRERKVEKRVLDFIREKRGYVEKGDQGALDAALSRECLCFDPIFNAVTIFFDFSYEEMLRYRRPPEYYSREEIARAAKDPTIVHYTLSFLSKRPWMAGCQHPWVSEWLRYKEMSPWKDMPLAEENRSWRVKLMRALPRKPMLWAAGFLQAHGRPWLYQWRMKRLRVRDPESR